MNSFSLIGVIPIVVTSAACLVCAATDLRRFRVPNAATLPLFASGLAFHGATAGWSGLQFGLTGAAFGFAVLFAPYAFGVMGAGDLKLLAGVGAWLGQPRTYHVLIAAVIFGGLYALFLAISHGRLRQTVADVRAVAVRGPRRPNETVAQIAASPDRRARLIPFAAMVALGLFATVVSA